MGLKLLCIWSHFSNRFMRCLIQRVFPGKERCLEYIQPYVQTASLSGLCTIGYTQFRKLSLASGQDVMSFPSSCIQRIGSAVAEAIRTCCHSKGAILHCPVIFQVKFTGRVSPWTIPPGEVSKFSSPMWLEEGLSGLQFQLQLHVKLLHG